MQVEKLLNERDGKEQELVELLKLSPQDIWNRDLENFLAEWQVRCRDNHYYGAKQGQLVLESDVAAAKGGKPKNKAAIKVAQKKKKLANGDNSDASDDFMPVKAVTKPKPKVPSKVSPAKRDR